jgi:hypothetical protein
MKYIKKFETHAEYNTYINGSGALLPNVSACVDQADVHYNEEHDYSQDYLTFVALESGTFTFHGNAVNYSLDDGETWTSLASNTASPTVAAGNKIMWKTNLTNPGASGIGTFVSTGNFNVSGNILSMVRGDNFKDITTIAAYQFKDLFRDATKLIDAGNLIIKTSNAAEEYCTCMFQGCTSLTTSPIIMVSGRLSSSPSYESMFSGCSSLNHITCLVSSVRSGSSSSDSFYRWVFGVASNGTFVKSESISPDFWESGIHGIPTGWTVQDA